MDAISIKNLVKIYASGVHALKGIDLEIKSGDFFALLGANGAGKTTIIGVITSLLTKTSGEVKIFDFDLDKFADKAKAMIGVVPQEFNFNIFEKVIDIVVSQGGYFGIDRKVALKNAEKILKDLNLWDKKDTPAMMLSGGMKRRLMIARALIHSPKLLVLDEPTAGVDVELRHDMWLYLKNLNKNGTTILLTTHYLEEVEQLCRNVAIIKSGEIIKKDSVKNMLQSLEKQFYIINVNKVIKKIDGYDFNLIDENTLEIEIGPTQPLNRFLLSLNENGFVVQDVKPKGNRIEQLYLSTLKN